MQQTEITLTFRTRQSIDNRRNYFTITIFLCIAFLLVLQGGCARKNALLPTPHLYTIGGQTLFNELDPELKSNQIDLMYVTDRLSEKEISGKLNYSHKRSPSAAYGSAIIELGDSLSWDELVTYSTEKSGKWFRPTVKVTSIKELGRFPATPYLYRLGGKGDLFEEVSRLETTSFLRRGH